MASHEAALDFSWPVLNQSRRKLQAVRQEFVRLLRNTAAADRQMIGLLDSFAFISPPRRTEMQACQ